MLDGEKGPVAVIIDFQHFLRQSVPKVDVHGHPSSLMKPIRLRQTDNQILCFRRKRIALIK
jgi:hypothetical protein